MGAREGLPLWCVTSTPGSVPCPRATALQVLTMRLAANLSLPSWQTCSLSSRLLLLTCSS